MRRRLLLAAPLAVAGCALAERPYAERRAWPLLVPRPAVLPARANAPVLLLRAVRAGPGLEARGLQSVQPDGSIRTAFYEEWAVPPAEGVEDQLRRWLQASGLFSAVTAPGSRLVANYTMDGSLDRLWTIVADKTARAEVAVLVTHGQAVTLQSSFPARAPLGGPEAGQEERAMLAALATCFAAIEDALRPLIA